MVTLPAVNLSAVLVATLASMAIGFIWYSPGFFGTFWMRLTGITQKDAEKGMRSAMVTGLLATFISMYFIAVLLAMVQPADLMASLELGFILWLALTLPAELHGVAWEKRPMPLLYINAGNGLVTVLVAIAVLQQMG